jgi:hypothetical protein
MRHTQGGQKCILGLPGKLEGKRPLASTMQRLKDNIKTQKKEQGRA